jgi:hypothetical protein
MVAVVHHVPQSAGITGASDTGGFTSSVSEQAPLGSLVFIL